MVTMNKLKAPSTSIANKINKKISLTSCVCVCERTFVVFGQ